MISVVVPALNEETHLPECLRSLMDQDWDDEYEIIVVDNGSTDKTADVARDLGVRVIACSTRGAVYARQAGANKARGEIIAQVDADTLYPKDWFSTIASYFLKHPDSAGLAGRYAYIQPAWWAPIERIYRAALNGIGRLVLHWPPSVSGANFAFRRDAFLKAKGYDPASLQSDQWGIARRLSRFGKIDYDDGLVVMTSSRRVTKPVYVLAYESLRNCYRVGTHFLRHCVRSILKAVRRQSIT
jgi:glycosyltransferase involved in cell wall biosynthesis